MIVALICSVLLHQVPVTVPGPMTKVARADSGDLCSLSESLSALEVTGSYELVVFVDGSIPYRTLNIYEHALFGPTGYFGMTVDTTTPVCPGGTPNAGRRPHVVSLGTLVPGIFRFEAVVFDDPLQDGVIVSSVRVTVQ